MEFGKPKRILVEGTPETNPQLLQRCRIVDIFCTSVGLTGLPTDPEPEVPPDVQPPSVLMVNPNNGPDGSTSVITGTRFQAQGPNSKVTIGGVEATIQSWSQSGTNISFTANAGANALDVPLPLVVTAEDGQESAPGATFQFNTVVPVILSVSPTSGPDGTEVEIAGSFPAAQGAGRVQIGTEDSVIVDWSPTSITAAFVQGGQPLDVPLIVVVHTDDGQSATATDNFTATAGAARSATKKKHSKRAIPTPPPTPVQHTMPTFPSGAGMMLIDPFTKKIIVGPFELEAGKIYPMYMEMDGGFEIVPVGNFDVTFSFAAT